MNIEQYRAMVAQEQANQNKEAVSDAQTELTTNADTTTKQEEVEQLSSTVEAETNPNQNGETEQPPEKTEITTIEIDGKEVPIDELKSGYMRQADYTRKTQEVSKKARKAEEALKIIEEIQKNPTVANALSQQLNMPSLDPEQAKIIELENKYYDLLIEKQINELTTKYGEFDVTEVLTTARDYNIDDLEKAYHVAISSKGGGSSSETIDVEKLKEELRIELMNDLQAQQDKNADTTTIISNGGSTTPVDKAIPKLSAQELKIAKATNMSAEEYIKWRDVNKNKR